METQPEINNQPIEPISTPEPPPKSKSWIIMILIVLCLAALAAAGYFYYQSQQLKKLTLMTQPTTQIPQPSSPPQPTTDPTTGWENKNYSSPNYQSFSFKYPTNWKVKENKPSSNNPSDTQKNIAISNGDYYIHINAFIDGWSPSGCNFPDTQQIPVQSFSYQDSVNITLPASEFRRAIPAAFPQTNPYNLWTICIKENGSNTFTTGMPFSGTITYNTPINSDSQILTKMDQILSTFKFLEPNTTPTTLSPKPTITSLTYSLPSDWVTAQDPDNAFEIGYNPVEDETKTYPDSDNRLFLVSTTGLKSMHSIFRVTEYDGGSRHAYLEKIMGEPLNNSDKLPDFREVEYIIQGKKCLIYDGYAISMSPQVWGMCPISSTKALFFNLSRQNLIERLTTIRFL